MKFKRTISLLLTFLIVTTVFTAVPFSVSAAENAETAMVGASSGTTGDCTWTLDDNGTLTISGNGKMGDYNYHNQPWRGVISVIIEQGVTSIGEWAFDGCASLTSVTIPDSVTSIGDYAFYGCTSLTSVTIGNGVTSIGKWAFQHCTSLKSITIPNSVTSIGEWAFDDCISLKSITIPDGVTSIGEDAFGFCKSLTSITIPDSVTSIGGWAFEDCISLKSITIPGSVTSIGDCAFSGCTSLTSITIPDSVTSIGEETFYYCESLTSITIPDSVTSIGNYAFRRCTSLTSVTIGNSVTSIGYRAFYYCTSLTSVTIGNGVKSIGKSAFSYCESLSDVYYGGNETQWNKIAIGNNNNWLTSAAIHFNSFTGYTDALAPVNTNSVAVKTSNGSTLNIELEKDLSFTVPSNVPLIGGKAMKLDLSFVPLTAAVTENSIKIGIGYNRDLTKDTDEQNWCNWKNYVKGYKDAVSKGKGLFDDIKNKKKGVASAGMGKDLDFEFYGYFEGTIQNGQVIGSGVAKIKLEGALKNEWQTAIGFVPIVVKLKGTIGVENNATLSLNFSTKKLSFANQLDITLPQITASAGVGIAHIADVSVYGDAKNVFSIYSKPKKITGTLFGELGVSAKALFWSAKLPILSIGNGSGWTYYDSTKNLFHLRWERLIMMI